MSAVAKVPDPDHVGRLSAYVARGCDAVMSSVHRRLSTPVRFDDLLRLRDDPTLLRDGVDFETAKRVRVAFEELTALLPTDANVWDVSVNDLVSLSHLGQRVAQAESAVAQFEPVRRLKR